MTILLLHRRSIQGIPPELDRITLKALAKKTDARYQTAEELQEDLETIESTLSDRTVRLITAPQSGVPFGSTIAQAFAPKRARALAIAALALVVAIPLVWFDWREPAHA